MKVLIWCGCLFGASFITAGVKMTGVTLGLLPVFLLYSGTFWLARTLCKKWDEHMLNKQSETEFNSKKQNDTAKIQEIDKVSIMSPVINEAENVISDKLICELCGTELPDDSKFCIRCGEKVLKNTASYCSQCGNELPQNSKFCNNCGAKIID